MSFKITALKVQKRNTQRVNVFLDGEFAFGLSRIVAAWLQVGQQISEEEIAVLKAKETYEAAFQQTLVFLNYRPRSEAEVRRNLAEHQFLEVVISETIERLRRSELLDDQRFAQAWVENRSEFRPRSRRALQMELRQRGLAEQAIEEALEAIDDDELAYQAACKQARKYKEAEWPVFRTKMTNFLARRGFHYGAIANAVKRVWEEKTEENDAADTY
jgi:regulatory protein